MKNTHLQQNHPAPKQVWGYMANHLQRLPGYAGASIVGTGAHYLLFLLLVRGFSVDVVLASTLGAVLGAVIIYLLNYFFIFKSGKKHLETASKFTLVAILSVLLNSLFLNAVIDSFALHYLFAQVLATLVVFALSYMINRIWTFSEQ